MNSTETKPRDKKHPRLILYNDNDAPLAIFYVESVYVPIDSSLNIIVNFEEDTAKAIRKGRMNMALLHMPDKVHRVELIFRHDISYVSKGDEITIHQVILPL